jgi:hypothetical protein
MEELIKIVSDEELNMSYANSNFGSYTPRDVVKGALLKCASGYHTGHTAKCIVSELGLVTKKWTLTKKGKQYLYYAFYNGTSI